MTMTMLADPNSGRMTVRFTPEKLTLLSRSLKEVTLEKANPDPYSSDSSGYPSW